MTGVNHAAGDPVARLELGMAYREYVMAPDNFIGTRILGSFPVRRKIGKWPKFLKEHFLRAAARVKRAPGTNASRSGIKSDDLTYTCVQRMHEVKIPVEDFHLYENEYDVEEAALDHAFFKVVLDQEIDIAAAIFDGTTSFTTANGRRTDVATAWSAPGSDIIGDVQDAVETVRQRTGMRPKTMVVGSGVMPYFLKNTAIRAALPNTMLTSVDAIRAALPMIFGVDQVLEGKGVYNSAEEGAPASITDIWSSDWCAIAHTAGPGASLAQPCVGRSLFWVDDANTESAMVEQYPERATRSEVYRAMSNADELLIDLDQLQLLDIAA